MKIRHGETISRALLTNIQISKYRSRLPALEESAHFTYEASRTINATIGQAISLHAYSFLW
jgi:hypothetical protein